MGATEKESQTTWAEKSGDKNVLSQIKWFFQKGQGDSWASKRKTKAFNLTRKESLISVWLSIIVVAWCAFYWWKVWNHYQEINSNTEALKNLSTYNVTPNREVLSSYIEWSNIGTINWMTEINSNVEEVVASREEFKKQQKSYYEVLLQNIYLPSLNIWKDPYTKNFDMTLLWQKYLENDKFQDLYLIQYWSDFVKYVGNDADYNTVDSMSIWGKVEIEGTDYFYTPITVEFSSPNKRSFLLLVNKLSMTSNSNNIALLNEFFFYLLMNIKEQKEDVINDLMQEYWSEFSTSSDWNWPTEFSELSKDEKDDYQDKVIWYNLYHRINYDWTWDNVTPLIDDNVIVATIRQNALCESSDMWAAECFYKFRDKYRNLPYLAYRVWLEQQSDRVDGLLEFLRDLSPAIAITSFRFDKYSNSSFLNNNVEQYKWSVTFNAYWRNVTEPEIDETAWLLWKMCFGPDSDQKISPDLALSRVNDKIASLWGLNESVNVLSLWELQWLFTDIKNNYNGLPKYNKMIKLFELWRMMNDANLCEQI